MMVIIILAILFSANILSGYSYGMKPSIAMKHHYDIKMEYKKVGLHYHQTYFMK